MLLAFSGYMPGMLLNIPKMYRTVPYKEELSSSNVNSNKGEGTLL